MSPNPQLWPSIGRLRFATSLALRHLTICVGIAIISATVVLGLLYPAPYRDLLGLGPIFLLVLIVDVVSGPLLTLVLASPKKSRRERRLDFILIGVIQLAALAYGLHTVWAGRPVALVFEVDRLVVVTANEIEPADLALAPEGLRRLPWWGVLEAGTRDAADNTEILESIERSLAGISPAMQPDWWVSSELMRKAMATRVKPVTDLIARRPQDTAALQAAIFASGAPEADLLYLPLVSSKTLNWIALLDTRLKIVGWAQVDGFD